MAIRVQTSLTEGARPKGATHAPGSDHGTPWSGRVWTRRGVLAATAGAAAGVTAACGHQARPSAAHGFAIVSVALDVYALEKISTATQRATFYRQVLSGFDATHRGIRTRLVAFAPTQANIAAIIAGNAPDVFPDEAPAYPTYVQQGLLLPLDSYLRRDAIDTTIWSPSLVTTFRTATGTYGLSRDINVYCFAVRLTDLDQAGLAYPSTDWTYRQFASLATALARPGQAHRFGATFEGGLTDFRQVLAGFGASLTTADRGRQTLGTAAGIAAGQWFFPGLVWTGAVAAGGTANLGNGTTSIQEIQGHALLQLFTQWGNQFKWTLYPPPVYPHGRFGNLGAAFWAINAGTHQPDAAWALLRWLAVDPPYQHFMMRTFLFPPALTTLLEQWRTTVGSIAPGLRGKGLRWIVQGARSGWGVPQPYFRTANSQAFAIDDRWWSTLLSHGSGVHTAFTQADLQVNALLAASQDTPMPSLQALRTATALRQQRIRAMFATADA